MIKPLTQIKLPTDRVNQLRLFAKGMDGATLSDALGSLFKMARDQGLVTHNIPSVRINALSDGIAIQFESEPIGFSFKEVQLIANGIRDCLAGRNEGQKIVGCGLAIGGSFSVLGCGNAIAVAVPESAAPKMFTRDLAADFADLLEYEIAKAKA